MKVNTQGDVAKMRRERFSSMFEVIGGSDKLKESIRKQILDRLEPNSTSSIDKIDNK